MLDSKVFLEEVIKESITIEPCKDSDKIQITVNGDFIKEHIYENLECKIKEYVRFIVIENSTEELARIFFDDDKESIALFDKQQARDYATFLAGKINKDIQQVLRIGENL